MASKDKAGGKRGLTPKQQRFVEEFLVDLNATQAAIRAGYSEKTAGAIGVENLRKPAIRSAIEKAQKARAERTEITQDDVIRRLVREADGAGEDTSATARIRATELLGKNIGMFVERQKIEHSGNMGPRDVRITLVKPDGTEETETRKDGKDG